MLGSLRFKLSAVQQRAPPWVGKELNVVVNVDSLHMAAVRPQDACVASPHYIAGPSDDSLAEACRADFMEQPA